MEKKLISSSYMNLVEKKVKYFIDNKWNGISRKDLDEWLNNFHGDSEEYIAYKLLDILIYYNEVETERIVRRLIEFIQRDYFVNTLIRNNKDIDDVSLIKEFKEFIKGSSFFPVGDDDPTGSGHFMCRILKKIGRDFGITEENFGIAKNLPLKMALGKRNFIFVDDMIGTGTQVSRFWNDKNVFDSKASLNDISKLNSDKNFYYITMAATTSGIEKVKRETENLKIIFSEYLTDDYDILSPQCTIWEDNEEMLLAISLIEDIKKRIRANSKFCRNLPVIFHHCSPNNTLQLYWLDDKKNNWKPLKGRF